MKKHGYCEHPDQFHHEGGSKCPHIGFVPKTSKPVCCKHSEPLKLDAEGWWICCKSCTTPFVTKDKKS